MSEFISLGKALVSAFAKQVSLNALLVSCSLTLFVVAHLETNRPCMYIGCGLLLFTAFNWIFKNYRRYKNRWSKKYFEFTMKNPKKQLEFLKSLDFSEIKLLAELFDLYPDETLLFFSNAAVVYLDECHCLVYIHNAIAQTRRGFCGYYCSLQPWVKRCIENNRVWFQMTLERGNNVDS